MQNINRRRFNQGLFLGFGLAGCAQLPTGAPDLIVTGLRWSDDDGATWHTGPIQAGTNVWFEADVKNQGTGPTPDGVIIGVGFRADGRLVSWSDDHTTALPAGQTISLRANGGPDGDKYWDNVQAGSYTLRAHVDDINRIPNELDETSNMLDESLRVAGQASAGVTVGSMLGAGNIEYNTRTQKPWRYTDLRNLHCSWVRASFYPDGYWANGSPSTTIAGTTEEIVYALNQGMSIYLLFEFYRSYATGSGYPARNYADWFALGKAFAAKFKPNSSFLLNQGIADRGIRHWSAWNECDSPRGETSGLTYAQWRDIMKGLADGVHSEDPDAKVYPGGFLGANRDSNYTCWGFLSTLAGMINDGTLAGFDLHCYHQQFAPLGTRYNRSPQSDFDACMNACGITNPNVDFISTEWNTAGHPYDTNGNYDVEEWFMQLFFNIMGLVRPDGTIATGVRLPFFFWWFSKIPGIAFTTESENPRVEKEMGITFHWMVDILHDMHFTFADPRGTGVYKLKGGGKSAWALQNNSFNWSSIYGSTFTISDIPSGTTQVQVYDGNGLIQTVSAPTLQKPRHTFSTPTGKSYLFIANAEELVA